MNEDLGVSYVKIQKTVVMLGNISIVKCEHSEL